MKNEVWHAGRNWGVCHLFSRSAFCYKRCRENGNSRGSGKISCKGELFLPLEWTRRTICVSGTLRGTVLFWAKSGAGRKWCGKGKTGSSWKPWTAGRTDTKTKWAAYWWRGRRTAGSGSVKPGCPPQKQCGGTIAGVTQCGLFVEKFLYYRFNDFCDKKAVWCGWDVT